MKFVVVILSIYLNFSIAGTNQYYHIENPDLLECEHVFRYNWFERNVLNEAYFSTATLIYDDQIIAKDKANSALDYHEACISKKGLMEMINTPARINKNLSIENHVFVTFPELSKSIIVAPNDISCEIEYTYFGKGFSYAQVKYKGTQIFHQSGNSAEDQKEICENKISRAKKQKKNLRLKPTAKRMFEFLNITVLLEEDSADLNF
jgi:hypothetical protein